MEKVIAITFITLYVFFYPQNENSSSPVDGSWIMVPASNGKTAQFKMFHDGFFSLVMQDKDDKWIGAAGKYSIEGNVYKETFFYSTVPEYVGVTDWQEFEIKGDTLYFSGFKKVVYPDGRDMTNNFEKFYEKRVRAK